MASLQSLDGPRIGAASGKAKQLLVLLHGYGADGADLIGLAPHLARAMPDTAFVAPNAPDPCEGGGTGWQWFPLPRGGSDTRAGIARAAELLEQFLAAELNRLGLAGEALGLVGFSQGTMMALQVGLAQDPPPAAIIGFSGALAGAPQPHPAPPPILLIHGDADPMIPPSASLSAAKTLAEAGIPAEWHISAGIGHAIGPDGLELASAFLARHLAKRM